jgi:hypothetical protein
MSWQVCELGTSQCDAGGQPSSQQRSEKHVGNKYQMRGKITAVEM